MLRRRPPARTFKLGFGDYALSFGGKQDFRRTRTGVPSKDFLEEFISKIKGEPAAEGEEATPLSTADLAGLFGGKTPRRGGFGFRPEVVRSMPTPPPETNGEVPEETATETEAVTDTPANPSGVLHGGLDDVEIHEGFLASLSESPKGGIKGSKVAGVKRARQFMRVKG